jgi:hypothetical protein
VRAVSNDRVGETCFGFPLPHVAQAWLFHQVRYVLDIEPPEGSDFEYPYRHHQRHHLTSDHVEASAANSLENSENFGGRAASYWERLQLHRDHPEQMAQMTGKIASTAVFLAATLRQLRQPDYRNAIPHMVWLARQSLEHDHPPLRLVDELAVKAFAETSVGKDMRSLGNLLDPHGLSTLESARKIPPRWQVGYVLRAEQILFKAVHVMGQQFQATLDTGSMLPDPTLPSGEIQPWPQSSADLRVGDSYGLLDLREK